jgi:cytochrome c oxidase assembly factor CtaG
MLIGAPALPLEYGLPWRSTRRALQHVLHSAPTQSLRRFLAHPLVCWLAPVIALIAWHVPAVFEAGVHSRGWHDVQAVSFLVTGILFWTPVVRWPTRLATAPRWLMPLYLFAATLPCDALSAFLVFCDRVVYPSYLSAPRLWNVSPLYDQQCAGALMWVSVTLIYVVPAVVITIQLLSPPQTYPRGAVRNIALRPSPVGESQVG